MSNDNISGMNYSTRAHIPQITVAISNVASGL
jgi:hypothetical protein